MDVKSKKRFASKVSKTTKPGFSDNHSVTSEKLIHNESMRSENTYQLHPEDDKKFKSYVVEGEMRRILSETLDCVDYKDSMGSALTTDLANDIKKVCIILSTVVPLLIQERFGHRSLRTG